MHVYYRISDNSYIKPKMCGKKKCLDNFLSLFNSCSVTFIADNVKSEETLFLLKNISYQQTSLGNSGSFMACLEDSISRFSDDQIIYFLEDDYLHYGNVVEALEEGLSMSEYATLYDHPDKYSSLYNFGEQTILSRKNYHWKQTISTTMTFASRVGTLKDDYGCFFKQTRNFHPNDHEIFLEINKKSKKLISCVPGMSIHTDLTVYSNMDKPYIDKWVSYV